MKSSQTKQPKSLRDLLYDSEESLGYEIADSVPSAQKARKILIKKYKQDAHRTIRKTVDDLLVKGHPRTMIDVSSWHHTTVNVLLKCLQDKGYKVRFAIDGKVEPQDKEEFNSIAMLNQRIITVEI